MGLLLRGSLGVFVVLCCLYADVAARAKYSAEDLSMDHRWPLAGATFDGPRNDAPLFVWPQPLSVQTGQSTVSVNHASFKINTTSKSALLSRACTRYLKSVFFVFTDSDSTAPIDRTGANDLSSLTISVSSDSEDLQFGVDESYTLTIPSGSATATLTAKSIWGALRGLETFSQAITFDLKSKSYFIPATPVTINDAPRFPWRGLLIDTSRHYLEVSAIKTMIEALAYAKFNTLHWHMMDAQSFPVETTRYPDLAGKGAYSAYATYDATDMHGIVAFAKDRGVRVMIEADLPGHAASWGVGYPNLTANCPSYVANINNIPLKVSNPFVYDVLTSFFSEMAAIFPDNFMHTGGDEVVFNCWLQDTDVVAWMKTMGYTTALQVEQYFETALGTIFKKALPTKTMMVWEELFSNGMKLTPGTVIEVWRSQAVLATVVKSGASAVLANGWYLDKLQPVSPPLSHYEWIDTWIDMYGVEPTAGAQYTPEELKRILGGEACMWGEQVDTVSIMERVWPRALAPAERLWSPKVVNDPAAAVPRMVAHACRMQQRGLAVGPLKPGYCPNPERIKEVNERKAKSNSVN